MAGSWTGPWVRSRDQHQQPLGAAPSRHSPSGSLLRPEARNKAPTGSSQHAASGLLLLQLQKRDAGLAALREGQGGLSRARRRTLGPPARAARHGAFAATAAGWSGSPRLQQPPSRPLSRTRHACCAASEGACDVRCRGEGAAPTTWADADSRSAALLHFLKRSGSRHFGGRENSAAGAALPLAFGTGEQRAGHSTSAPAAESPAVRSAGAFNRASEQCTAAAEGPQTRLLPRHAPLLRCCRE